MYVGKSADVQQATSNAATMVFQALPTLKAIFPGNYVLDVCLSWLSGPSLGVHRIPASDGTSISSAYLMYDMSDLRFDVFEI